MPQIYGKIILKSSFQAIAMNKDQYSEFNKIKEAYEFIQSKTLFDVEIGVVLGTGLGAFIDKVEDSVEVPYQEIPHFPQTTVEGHSGKLVFGKVNGKRIVIMAGRFHYYEGYSMEEIILPIRVLALCGIKHLFVSNIAGGLLPEMQEGDLYLIGDHINLLGTNPLIGLNDDRFGPRFTDMKDAYDKDLISLAEKTAKHFQISLGKTVYAAMTGPSLETNAEYNMLHILGAGLVGMSTVPEVIAARHMGISVLGISVVSNVCYPTHNIQAISIESILKTAKIGGLKVSQLFTEMIGQLII